MQQKMKSIKLRVILLLLPMLLIALLIQTPAQEIPAEKPPSENGAKITPVIPSASASDDDPLAQMLQQSIAEARAYKALAETRLVEIQRKDVLLALDEKEIAKLKSIIETSDKLIARLEKQCSTTSFLFGLIKFKKC